MAPRATEVFTPGSFPNHTYVARPGESLEEALGDALATRRFVGSVRSDSLFGTHEWRSRSEFKL